MGAAQSRLPRRLPPDRRGSAGPGDGQDGGRRGRDDAHTRDGGRCRTPSAPCPGRRMAGDAGAYRGTAGRRVGAGGQQGRRAGGEGRGVHRRRWRYVRACGRAGIVPPRRQRLREAAAHAPGSHGRGDGRGGPPGRDGAQRPRWHGAARVRSAGGRRPTKARPWWGCRQAQAGGTAAGTGPPGGRRGGGPARASRASCGASRRRRGEVVCGGGREPRGQRAAVVQGGAGGAGRLQAGRTGQGAAGG